DVAILQGNLDWAIWFLAHTSAAAQWSYYDAFQRRDPGARDFRSLSPSVRLTHELGAGQLSAGGGYRWVTFKPEPDFDFRGPSAFLRYRHLILPGEDDEGPEWDLSTGLSVERRGFAGLRCLPNDVCPPVMPAGQRSDDLTTLAFEAVRT